MASIGDDGVMCRVGLLSRLGRRLVITPKGEMFGFQEADRQHRTIPEPGCTERKKCFESDDRIRFQDRSASAWRRASGLGSIASV
jgi:hypothetical protein